MVEYNEQAVRSRLREAFARQPLGEPLTEDTRQALRDAVEVSVTARAGGFELRDLIFHELASGIGERGSVDDIERVRHDVLAVFVKAFSPLILENSELRRN